MAKLLIIYFLVINFTAVSAEESYPNSQNGPFADPGPGGGGGDGALGIPTLLRGWSSSSGNSRGYNNGYSISAPIYGNAQYTYGPINGIHSVNTGYSNSNYGQYSNNYWTCVNNYRGQYYYSYNHGYYVCDTRANRYGK